MIRSVTWRARSTRPAAPATRRAVARSERVGTRRRTGGGDTAEVVERLESLVLDRPGHEPFWARPDDCLLSPGSASRRVPRLPTRPRRLVGRAGDRPVAGVAEARTGDPRAERRTGRASSGRSVRTRAWRAINSTTPSILGREDLVAQLVEAVRTASFVVVVGSSGAGKSSALRAGLVRAVETDS